MVRGVLNKGRRGSWGGVPRDRPARSPAGESFSVGALEKERGRRRGRQAGPAGQRRSARRGLSGTDRWARGAGRERGAGQRAVREAAHCGCQVGQGGSGSTRQAVGEASATRRVQAGLRHASRAEREGRAGRCGARLGRVESWAAHGWERESGPAGALGQGEEKGEKVSGPGWCLLGWV